MPKTALAVLGDTKPVYNRTRPAHKPVLEEWARRVTANIREVYADPIASLAVTLVDGVVKGTIPVNVARLMLFRLLPAKVPADVGTLPPKLDTPQDWLASLQELRDLRRQGRLTDDEWLTLIRAENETWRAMQEAKALIEVGRR